VQRAVPPTLDGIDRQRVIVTTTSRHEKHDRRGVGVSCSKPTAVPSTPQDVGADIAATEPPKA
jgi:hypothetical protein